MKRLLPALPVAGALLALATGCQPGHNQPICDLTPCPTAEVPITAVPNWRPSPYCFGPRVEQPGQYQTYVINSMAELQAVSHCPDSVGIDFSRYTLLAGKTKTLSCNYVAEQRVEATCTGLVYHVVVKPSLCQALSEALYTAVIPKQPANQQVRFDVQVQQ